MISDKRHERVSYVERFIKAVQRLLKHTSIECEVIGRPKHLYSIYKKLTHQNLTFDELYDMLGIRIIGPVVGGGRPEQGLSGTITGRGVWGGVQCSRMQKLSCPR